MKELSYLVEITFFDEKSYFLAHVFFFSNKRPNKTFGFCQNIDVAADPQSWDATYLLFHLFSCKYFF